MKRNLMIGAVIAAIAFPAIAFSSTDGDHKGPPPLKGEMFERLDTNKDGQITFEEMTARTTVWFKKLDKNGDGELSVDEMNARKKAFFDKIDTDKNGSISKAEADAFRDQMHDKYKGKREAFMMKRLDINGDGVVTKEEYESFTIKRFDNADANGDGKLSADELSNLMPHKHMGKPHKG